MNDAMDEAKEKSTSFLKDMKQKMDKVCTFTFPVRGACEEGFGRQPSPC